MSRHLIAVSEIFGPVLQGEGPVLGEPTVFVRTGGCDLRCAWCDSLHAVLPEHKDEWRTMVPEQVMEQVRRLSPDPILVTLSGGNPAMQPCGPLIAVGKALRYRFCAETQGTIAADWFGHLDVVVFSPKPPSSGMPWRNERFERCLRQAGAWDGQPGRQVAVKVPVFDLADLAWVESEIVPRCTGLPLYLSVGNPFPPADRALPDPHASGFQRGMLDEQTRDLQDYLLERYEWLAGEVLRRGLRARVTPQMHVLVHGNRRQV